jgi:hypothetical protein
MKRPIGVTEQSQGDDELRVSVCSAGAPRSSNRPDGEADSGSWCWTREDRRAHSHELQLLQANTGATAPGAGRAERQRTCVQEISPMSSSTSERCYSIRTMRRLRWTTTVAVVVAAACVATGDDKRCTQPMSQSRLEVRTRDAVETAEWSGQHVAAARR